jgi:hypothetical protein
MNHIKSRRDVSIVFYSRFGRPVVALLPLLTLIVHAQATSNIDAFNFFPLWHGFGSTLNVLIP